MNDILTPVIGLVLGGVDFSGLFVALDGKTYTNLQAAKDAKVATLNYGLFINAVIDFLIIAFVIFLLVRTVNRMTANPPAPPAAPTAKECPYCLSTIPLKATRCAHCTSELKAA